MKSRFLMTWVSLAAFVVVVGFTGGSAAGAEEPIDPVRGRQLMEKSSRGEDLTPEEQAYLERVRQEIQRRRTGKAPAPAARPEMPVNHTDWSALVPLTDMPSPYKGEEGGLYGGGRNELPAGHL